MSNEKEIEKAMKQVEPILVLFVLVIVDYLIAINSVNISTQTFIMTEYISSIVLFSGAIIYMQYWSKRE